MKQIIALPILFFFLGTAYAQNISQSNIPAVVLNSFQIRFPNNKEYASLEISNDTKVKAKKAFNKGVECMPINQQTDEEAYQAVLINVGCVLPVRDAIDTRIIEEVRTGTAGKGENGYVRNPEMAGGWPILKTGPVTTDTDHDGMPDKWERKNGLNPNDASDRNIIADNGYTMLEKYLNSIEYLKGTRITK